MRRLIVWLCFVGLALATTSLAAFSLVCTSKSVYLAADGSAGWEIDWHGRYARDVPMTGIMQALSYHAPSMPLNDCSRDDIRCVFVDEKFDLKAFAIRNGEIGDSYRVAHWTFKIERKSRSRARGLTWVSFKDDDKGGYSGHFLYDADRGIVSITKVRDDKSTSTMVLTDGPGLLAPGLICAKN